MLSNDATLDYLSYPQKLWITLWITGF